MLMLYCTVFYFSSEQNENTKQFKLFSVNPNILICRVLEQNRIEWNRIDLDVTYIIKTLIIA